MIGIIMKIFGFGLFIWSTDTFYVRPNAMDTDIEKDAGVGTLSMEVFGNCRNFLVVENYLLSSWKKRSRIMKISS